MTDLTFCYLHMTSNDLKILDTLGTSDYFKDELSDDEMDIPPHMVPPNPDDSEILPSQVHPSYPYGNPLSLKHPASRPRIRYDPTSRALYEDMGYAGGGVNGSLRWTELALDTLLPVDVAREEAVRAAQARKMATGAAQQQQQQQPHQPPPPITTPMPQDMGNGPPREPHGGMNGDVTTEESEDETMGDQEEEEEEDSDGE